MISRPQILTAATAITLLTIAGPATAFDHDKLAYASEVKSCVAEVDDHANYDDAARVQHIVVKVKRTEIGYVFTIDTSVFTDADDDAVREYASYCVARGDETLVKFRIRGISA